MRPATFGLFLLSRGLFAQDRHVSWKLSVDPPAAPPGGKVLVRMAGHIDDGWHLYSMSTPAASPTKIQLAASPAIEKFRAFEPQPRRAFDANFNSDTETYEGDVTFLLELELKKDAPAGAAGFSFSARFQTCAASDGIFNADPETYEGDATFLLELDQKKDAPAGAPELSFSARFQTCN